MSSPELSTARSTITPPAVDVLFLSGPPGAGKTAVAKEISELLWQLREPHAVIDLDELCRCVLPTPAPNFNRALAAANLSVVWANYAAAGVRRLVLARMLQSAEDLAQFVGAVPNAHVTLCVLQAPASTVQQRITAREPGSARAFLLSASAQIAAQMENLELPAIPIDNDQRPLTAVAREVLERAGWPCPSR